MSSPTITPSIRLLFSFISRRHLLILLLPAIFASIIAGGVAPFMTFVVGQAFDAFANFPITPNPPQAAKDALLRDVGLAALQLIGLGVGALALGSLTSCLWIWIGETNAMALRKAIYVAVSQKDLTWFDMHTTTDGSSAESSVGAGGLMAKFSRYPDLFFAIEKKTLISILEKPTKSEWHHLWLLECSFSTLPLVLLASSSPSSVLGLSPSSFFPPFPFSWSSKVFLKASRIHFLLMNVIKPAEQQR